MLVERMPLSVIFKIERKIKSLRAWFVGQAENLLTVLIERLLIHSESRKSFSTSQRDSLSLKPLGFLRDSVDMDESFWFQGIAWFRMDRTRMDASECDKSHILAFPRLWAEIKVHHMKGAVNICFAQG